LEVGGWRLEVGGWRLEVGVEIRVDVGVRLTHSFGSIEASASPNHMMNVRLARVITTGVKMPAMRSAKS
jgi:hypothetical protein